MLLRRYVLAATVSGDIVLTLRTLGVFAADDEPPAVCLLADVISPKPVYRNKQLRANGLLFACRVIRPLVIRVLKVRKRDAFEPKAGHTCRVPC